MIRVLYTGAFRFPEADAAASRVYSIGKLFQALGCSVSFAGWESAEPGQNSYRYKGHDCYPQSEFRDRPRSAPARLLGFLLRGTKTLNWLARHPRFDVVVAYNPPALFALALLALCAWRRVALVLDSTEWYESEHLVGGRFGVAAWENRLRMRVVYRLFRHVICISVLLAHHFRGRNVVNIPPLASGAGAPADKPPILAGVFFLYAGEVGKKDRLVSFIAALPLVQAALQRQVMLRIAGVDWPTMQQHLRADGLNPADYASLIECHGRVTRQAVAFLYDRSHFSILFREDKRYARAGFPTKAVESWSHGCPIIANPVGDVGTLAQNGLDAILVDEADLAQVVPAALRSIVDSDRYPTMSASCTAKARRLFSPHAHLRDFDAFVRRLNLPIPRNP